ncbi:MAG: hypothetical protein HQL59_13325 [Magnetococcales bacterium]|nr:hypothetical protein [Magnetococcales bacterium]
MSMLREVTAGRVLTPFGRRRWFQDATFDLFVWTGADGALLAFQLCHDRGRPEEGILTWRQGLFSQDRLDAGEDSPWRNESPIARPDGEFSWERWLPRIRAGVEGLEPALREAVLRTLIGCAAGGSGDAVGGRTDGDSLPAWERVGWLW